MATILLTGGAGYIGSITGYLLSKLGHEIIIIDNFVHNQKADFKWATILRGNCGDQSLLDEVFSKHSIDAVMHFAAFIEVGESVKKPSEFYENNVCNTLTLLQAMVKYNIKQFIFSSSCAIYGNPVQVPMSEEHPIVPLSPYAKTKTAVEFILQDFAQTYDFKYVSLRYFNAAGALVTEGLGEQHDPETHLIPRILRFIMNDEPCAVFGNSFDTPDGTCVRDYIHVKDLAQAHIKSLEYLEQGGASDSFNLGTGDGYSVLEMIQAAQKVVGKKADISMQAPRPGDVPVLVADARKIKRMLGFELQHSDLTTILQSAWEWEQKRVVL
jgi:UDP-glucose 4-epimerase